jgi:acetolactate decarboxylase
MAFDPELIAALHPRVVGAAGGERAFGAFQTSTVDALLHGRYEGDVSIADLLRHGDLGLGTMDHLDGELIVVDGEAFAARADGSVRPVAGDERTPFAVVTPFDAQVQREVHTPTGLADLYELIDGFAGDVRGARAIRIDGELVVHARSVPRQEPPYRPLADVAAEQQVFDLDGVEGTLVGFRFPKVAAGIEVPGYHLHAITADRTRGGHVLDARLRTGTVRIGQLTDLRLELPRGVELPEGPGDADALDQVEHSG